MRLARTMLFVKDLARMTEFYSSTLGLQIIPASRQDGYIEFESGLALHAIPEQIARNKRSHTGRFLRSVLAKA